MAAAVLSNLPPLGHSSSGSSPNIGVLVIRTRFSAIVYYDYKKKPKSSISYQ